MPVTDRGAAMTCRPNIIFILCDQLRWDALGFSGNTEVRTPNVDYLAACGARFSHAYSEVPSCVPARAIIWSGQNQWHTGVLGMGPGQGQIPNDFTHTLAGELKKAGYQTHLVGKGHFWPQRTGMGFEHAELDESGRTLPLGFLDDYRSWFRTAAPSGVSPDDHGVNWNSWHARPWHLDEHLHPTAWTMSRAIEFLKTRDRDRPFFLNISFARPHSPYVPPDPYFQLYRSQELPEPFTGRWSTVNGDRGDASDPNAWRGKMPRRAVQSARAGYYGEVSFIDTQVGRLLNWLQRFAPDELPRTWMVFTSDHGDMLGDHYLWRKTYAYEGSAHIPLVIAPPLSGERPARSAPDEPVGLQDIMPTILDIAAVSPPPTIDGTSLLSLLEGPSAAWQPFLHGEHCACYGPEQEMQYVTDGRRKLIWLPRCGLEQFFDLEKDPGETQNLIDDPIRHDDIEEWRSYLLSALTERDCGWTTGGALRPPDDEPLVSPFKDRRWRGS
jgi:arylsulfatase A-like enzyme